MSMFPHTVTLYNIEYERDPEDVATEKTVTHITILRGVLLDATKAVNVRTSGIDSADAANLYIPFDVEAVDGVTNEPKTYMGPVDFWKSEEKSKHWTLQADPKNFVVKGEAVEPGKDFDFIGLKYDGVYVITKVDEKDFGGLQHFEVGMN